MTDLDGSVGPALETILPALERVPVPWALTGSTALALRGVDLDPEDVDLQTTAGGAYAVEAAIDGRIVSPVRYVASRRIRSHFGELAVADTRVEVMGAVQTRGANGAWTPPTPVRSNRCLIEAYGTVVPVMCLGHEARAYERLGRPDRAAQIRAMMRNGDGDRRRNRRRHVLD